MDRGMKFKASAAAKKEAYEKAKKDALTLNPQLKIIEVSCKTEAGLRIWVEWLTEKIEAFRK